VCGARGTTAAPPPRHDLNSCCSYGWSFAAQARAGNHWGGCFNGEQHPGLQGPNGRIHDGCGRGPCGVPGLRRRVARARRPALRVSRLPRSGRLRLFAVCPAARLQNHSAAPLRPPRNRLPSPALPRPAPLHPPGFTPMTHTQFMKSPENRARYFHRSFCGWGEFAHARPNAGETAGKRGFAGLAAAARGFEHCCSFFPRVDPACRLSSRSPHPASGPLARKPRPAGKLLVGPAARREPTQRPPPPPPPPPPWPAQLTKASRGCRPTAGSATSSPRTSTGCTTRPAAPQAACSSSTAPRTALSA
jgi:hypothetical protein